MKIIKNSTVLSQDYVPETIIGREEQIKRLRALIRGSDVSSAFIVTGSPGTGKTLIGRYLLKEMREFKTAYVNCYINQTDRAIVSAILNDPNIRLPEIGSTRSESLSSLLFRELPDKNNLVVLDETQSLKRTHPQIVYALSRSKELGGPEVKLVMLSMEEPEVYLDKSTLSGLGRYNRFALKEYGAEELYRIISARAAGAFYEGSYTDAALERISELVEENGSARIALELLKNSALLAESRNVFLDEEAVLEAYRDFSPPLEESSLIGMEDEEIELLRALLEGVKAGRSFRTSDLRNIDRGISDSKIYKFLKTMETAGLVKKSKIGKGYSGGVENEYILRVSPLILLSKLEMMEKTQEPYR